MSNDVVTVLGMGMGIAALGFYMIPNHFKAGSSYFGVPKYMAIGTALLVSGFIISFYGQFYM